MSLKNLKVGIIGMGPVGQILAVHLKEAGCELAICDRGKEKMNLIRKEGIHLEGKVKKHAYFNTVLTSISELMQRDMDLLIFSVKSHHMKTILPQFGEIPEDNKMCVISAQNGIDVESILANVFGDSTTLRMVVNFAGNLHAPNVVNVTFFNPPNYIASIDDSKTDLSKWFADVLTSVSLTTKHLDSFSITNRIWEKTILNSSLSALCGISKLTIKEAMEFHDTVEVIEQLIIEAMDVAKAEEIKFPDNFVKLCMRYLKRAGDHFPSMAVDMINNRETEIDYFNGKIVEYGKKHYIRSPLNLTFTNLVKAAYHRNKLAGRHEKHTSETILDM